MAENGLAIRPSKIGGVHLILGLTSVKITPTIGCFNWSRLTIKKLSVLSSSLEGSTIKSDLDQTPFSLNLSNLASIASVSPICGPGPRGLNNRAVASILPSVIQYLLSASPHGALSDISTKSYYLIRKLSLGLESVFKPSK